MGTGRHVYPEDQQVHRAPYPWLAAQCGDIDITGQRLPLSYYREIVYGLTQTPYLAVRRPRDDGYVIKPKAWTWSDVSPSWTFDVAAGYPLHVEIYFAADDVELRLNGNLVKRVDVGKDRDFVAEAEVPYAPGILEVIAFRDGKEVGRSALRTVGEPALIDLATGRAELRADPQQLAYIELSLIDENGTVNPNRDVAVTISIEGPGVLQGFGSGVPFTEESFLDSTTTTFTGKALAVVRATGAPGRIIVTARTESLPDAVLYVNVADHQKGDG